MCSIENKTTQLDSRLGMLGPSWNITDTYSTNPSDNWRLVGYTHFQDQDSHFRQMKTTFNLDPFLIQELLCIEKAILAHNWNFDQRKIYYTGADHRKRRLKVKRPPTSPPPSPSTTSTARLFQSRFSDESEKCLYVSNKKIRITPSSDTCEDIAVTIYISKQEIYMRFYESDFHWNRVWKELDFIGTFAGRNYHNWNFIGKTDEDKTFVLNKHLLAQLTPELEEIEKVLIQCKDARRAAEQFYYHPSTGEMKRLYVTRLTPHVQYSSQTLKTSGSFENMYHVVFNKQKMILQEYIRGTDTSSSEIITYHFQGVFADEIFE